MVGGLERLPSRRHVMFTGVDVDQVYLRPSEDRGYTYPTAQYDHNKGNAIGGGFVYEGDAVPQLRGKFVFCDLVRGRVF